MIWGYLGLIIMGRGKVDLQVQHLLPNHSVQNRVGLYVLVLHDLQAKETQLCFNRDSDRIISPRSRLPLIVLTLSLTFMQ